MRVGGRRRTPARCRRSEVDRVREAPTPLAIREGLGLRISRRRDRDGQRLAPRLGSRGSRRTALIGAGRIDEARAELERAVAIFERKRCLTYAERLGRQIDLLG